MENFGPLTAEIGLPVWGTDQILTGFASWLYYYSNVAHCRPTKLCTIFGRLLGWYTVYTSLGAFAPDRILPRAKFTLHPSLAFSYIAALLHGTPAVGLSQTLRRGTRNGMQRAPHIFCWAAITLGIGPHSSCGIASWDLLQRCQSDMLPLDHCSLCYLVTSTFMAIIQDNLFSRHPEFRTGGFCWSSFTVHLPLLIATSVFGVGRRH